MLCGVGLAAVAFLVSGRRQEGRGRTLVLYAGTLAGLLVVIGLALAFIYPGSYGLRLDLLAWPGDSAKQVYGTRSVDNHAEAAAAGVTFVRRWLPMLLPCAGLLVLLRRRSAEPAGWIGLGVVVGGLVAVLSLTHPSASQYYFAAAALPVGLALSGAGAGLFVQTVLAGADELPGRQTVRVRGRALLGPGAVIVGAVLVGVVWQATRDSAAAPRVSPAVGEHGAFGAWALAWQWASPTLLMLGLVLLVVTLGWVVLVRRRDQPRAGAWGGLLALASLAIGVLALVPDLKIGYVPGPPVSPAQAPPVGKSQPRPAVSPALFEAGQYLRLHAAPSDVIATNRIWNGRTKTGYRDNRDFSVVALSGLRTDVSGYGYAPRMVQAASETGVPYFYAPFWDPARLAEELMLVTDPTRARLDAAHDRRGVRWIVADERSGPVWRASRSSPTSSCTGTESGSHGFARPARDHAAPWSRPLRRSACRHPTRARHASSGGIVVRAHLRPPPAATPREGRTRVARLFGTDGVRGVANKDITAELALDLSVAAAHVLAEVGAFNGHRPVAVVGRDPRASGEFLAAATVAGLASAGIDVRDAGVLPTPAIAYLVAEQDADLGAMLSASHNPMPDNGIKFFARGGHKLADDLEDRIEDRLRDEWQRPTGGDVGRITPLADGADRYVAHLLAVPAAPARGTARRRRRRARRCLGGRPARLP